MHTCTKCLEEKEDCEFGKDVRFKNGLRRNCKACFHAKYLMERESKLEYAARYKAKNAAAIRVYQKKYRVVKAEQIKAKQREYKKAAYQDPLKRFQMLSRLLANAAAKAGILTKKNACSTCQQPAKTELHHHDYTKPLDVVELCNTCHRYEHKRLRELAESV